MDEMDLAGLNLKSYKDVQVKYKWREVVYPTMQWNNTFGKQIKTETAF